MNRHKFFKDYKARCYIDNESSHQNLAKIFESILQKRTALEKPKLFNVFDENTSLLIFEPLDYQFPIENRKETCLRMIYIYLSKNEIIHALNVFIYLIHNYNPNSSWIWRTGFHILSRIGDEASMAEFFKAVLDTDIWDPSNLFYEYFLYLLAKKNYTEIGDLYNNDYQHRCQTKRMVREPEMETIHHLIRLTTAVSFYCRWKESLQADNEDEDALNQAELEFGALSKAIEAGLIVDSPLLNYVDVLKHLGKFTEALEVLQQYYDTCTNNIHAVEYLLDFMIQHQQILPNVTDEKISELRSIFVLKSIRVSPDEPNKFLLRSFRTYVEELDENGRHEDLVKLLFDYLCDVRWVNVEWPWRYLWSSIQKVGVSSGTVQRLWNNVADVWLDLVFSSPSNPYIEKLAAVLQ